eukprot:scaffold113745_cov33-Phaeocystis_antarctica.AAC.1
MEARAASAASREARAASAASWEAVARAAAKRRRTNRRSQWQGCRNYPPRVPCSRSPGRCTHRWPPHWRLLRSSWQTKRCTPLRARRTRNSRSQPSRS